MKVTRGTQSAFGCQADVNVSRFFKTTPNIPFWLKRLISGRSGSDSHIMD